MYSKVFGWARSLHSYSLKVEYETKDPLPKNLNVRGAIPRGLGRSYGDSSLNSGGVVLESKRLNHIHIDPKSGTAVVGAGVTLADLEIECLKFGFFPFVVPGTAKVTLGGAIASDIHGKSHHKVGSFSCHLVEMKILDSKGNISVIQPCGETSDLFWATVGGMGLTGLIVEATINLMKIETAFVSVSEKRVKSLDELIQTLMKFNVEHHYTVAWVDLSGDFRGRGIVSAADHILLKDLPQNLEPTKLKSVRQTERSLPIPFGFCLINNFTIRVFNFLWLHKPLGRAVQQIQKYMHPLDGFSNWNILYGKRGFVQYQFVIPIDKHSVLKLILAKLQAEKCASFLTVLKTLGQPSKGLIGFPMEGWTLAIDLPLGNRNLNRILSELDDLVLRASGRLYLTKDSRMRPEHLDFMYPEIQRWKSIKSEFDSENYWQSDQGRRLKLC